MIEHLHTLQKELQGELLTDKPSRLLYATDASVYREIPLAVAKPKDKEDIKKLIAFANKFKLSLIPRTAGTSLAGQVVGSGIVVDVSRYMTEILEVNTEEKWVRVQPGVIRDDLNAYLKQFGLFFGPITSTSNRAMIGGMVGNNSCGQNSVVYGTTRDHLLELSTILSDGSEVVFGPLDKETYAHKCAQQDLEGKIYRHTKTVLSDPKNQEEIRKAFPKPEINRRNTGYAIDVLLNHQPFNSDGTPFNFCKLLAGSEGTLAFTTEIKLNLVDLPPKEKGVVAIHFKTLEEAWKANLIALKYKPNEVELMDHFVLECTKGNIEQQKNRFFIDGDPAAVVVVGFAKATKEEVLDACDRMENEMRAAGYGYHFPRIFGPDIKKVWALRKAGLGLLSNIPGDPKAVACIEDTAVSPQDLPEYMREFKELMEGYKMDCVHYAHIGDGEIHLRPILDLKKKKDRQLFFDITNDVATLVKKYRGSMSGEHGDGRVRGPFVRKMIGDHNYMLLEEVKRTWDPNNIFNPGKIVNTPKMNESLRYEEDMVTPEINTTFDFSETAGILRMAEKCNGSGDCRKSAISGGTMCPSFMATKNEQATTRGRANILREFLTNSTKANRFDHQEIKEAMDLCLSCKGCKSECPSNVDVAMMKSEFLQQYYQSNGIPFRAKMIGKVARANKMGATMPGVYNFINNNPLTGPIIKGVMGIAQKRSLPALYKTTLRKWAKKNLQALQPATLEKGKVLFFADEIVNYNDVEIGITAIKLLTRLGYEVEVPKHEESGRPAISKGMLRYAKQVAEKNITLLKGRVNEDAPLIGIEPSAILTFRDEYPKLVNQSLRQPANTIAKHVYLIDEFIAGEIDKGNITADQFNDATKNIKLHGHCHQKALSSVSYSEKLLSLPVNYTVEVIPSGCCGMSGSFGYEKEHYQVSMDIGELVLFPAIREAAHDTVIAAPGTSCRHQIKDGVQREALHPVEILFEALK